MTSGSRRKQREGPAVCFFVERSLGRVHVTRVFREAGFEVVLMAERYPDGADQLIGDDEWILDVGKVGMVALTKDAAILRDHRSALEAARLRVFALTNANLPGPQMADQFRAHLNRIVQRARKPGPFFDAVGRTRIERRWPREGG